MQLNLVSKLRAIFLHFKFFWGGKNNNISIFSQIGPKVRFTNSNTVLSKAFIAFSEFAPYSYVSSSCFVKNAKFGICSYVSPNSKICGCIVGKYSSIGPNVLISDCGKHPTRDYVSIYPGFYSNLSPFTKHFVNRCIFDEFTYLDNEGHSFLIGNDVWVCENVVVLPGIKIGDGAIVAAGAVVTKDVPPYAIVGGVPAKIIRYRFSDNQIQFLEKLKWWDKDVRWIEAHAQYFNSIDLLMEKIKL